MLDITWGFLDTIRSTYNIIFDKKFGERERVGKDCWLRIADPQERTDMFREK